MVAQAPVASDPLYFGFMRQGKLGAYFALQASATLNLALALLLLVQVVAYPGRTIFDATYNVMIANLVLFYVVWFRNRRVSVPLFRLSKVEIAIFAYILWLAVTSFWGAPNFADALDEFDQTLVFYFVFVRSTVAVLPFVNRALVDRALVLVLVIAAVTAAMAMIDLMLDGTDGQRRLTGLISKDPHAIKDGNFWCAAGLIAVLWAAKNQTVRTRTLLTVLGVVLLTAGFLSESRSVLIGLLGAIGLIALVRPRCAVVAVGWCALAFSIAVTAPIARDAVFDRMNRETAASRPAVDDGAAVERRPRREVHLFAADFPRLTIWKNHVIAAFDSPQSFLFGTGRGTRPKAFGPDELRDKQGRRIEFHPHSLYVATLRMYGAVGLVILLGAMSLMLTSSLGALRKDRLLGAAVFGYTAGLGLVEFGQVITALSFPTVFVATMFAAVLVSHQNADGTRLAIDLRGGARKAVG